jgi:hypothetical protein
VNDPPTDPLQYHPNLKPDDPKEGLICFRDAARVCGADCMAYELAPPGPDYDDKQWATCMLLVNTHRVGKHLVVLASVGSELLKRAKNESADRARANQPPPPTVK